MLNICEERKIQNLSLENFKNRDMGEIQEARVNLDMVL
ncbi:hypothetical protein NEF87_001886 [Candidatus Lokiarchaeum ossiferum]|uniref:Uncharacterized protein n=1 Tax=Candidatus Lokiarchaeum ossiferum TaxID=2951803 RepID=A0ABY6HSS3_9ARCH|nr:hypothetical protein NEF87_001886 [Candidatus Lokiarchaeum sp. B-35]